MSYPELRLYAEMFNDVQEFRKSMENKVRSSTVDRLFVGAALDQYSASEHELSLAMRQCFRQTVAPGIINWQKENNGIGEHLLARLLGVIGDPRVAVPRHWQGTGSERVLIEEEPRARTIGQLWSYCGHGDAARKRARGMDVDEALALGNPAAKSLVWNIANACVKAGVRKADETDSGEKKAISHYGAVYLDARAKYEDRSHPTDCVRCGPSGKPALAGSPLSKAHQHATGLRIVGKTALKDLWIAAGDQSQIETHVTNESGSD